MKRQNILSILTVFGVILITGAARADRITLKTGDIFIGKILALKDYRYWIERFGAKTRHPSWWIKKIESGVDQLELSQGPTPLQLVTPFVYEGRSINVTSESPAKVSHLEMYPRWSHYWIEKHRYLRGYLVNLSTDEAYRRLEIRFTYYNAQRKVVHYQSTEIFDVYPMTMKPFIIDTISVSWNVVESIRVEVTASNKFKKEFISPIFPH